MKGEIQQSQSIVFTEQRVFTLGDERFRQALPVIESGYSKIKEGCRATFVDMKETDDYEGDDRALREKELFFKNAYRLFENRDVILADSRLSMAQLPFSRAFEGIPTLGEYLVWWQNYRCSQVENEQGERCFVYNYFFKSSNCHCVDRQGRAFSAEIDASSDLRASFGEARSMLKSCSIYTSERDVCSLEQVIEVLDII